MIRIEYLADCTDVIPLISGWVFDEWGKFDLQKTREVTVANFQARTNRERIPMAFVAFDSETPVGTVSLKLNAMKIRPEYNPWVGSLYVTPDHRGGGVGTALMQHAMAKAAQLGIPRLYLWSERAEEFYKTLGFLSIETVRYLNQDARVMRMELGERTATPSSATN